MLREIEAYMSQAKLVASPLKLGAWLVESLGAEIASSRRAREDLAAEASELPSPPPPITRALPPSRSSSTAAVVPSSASPAEPLVERRSPGALVAMLVGLLLAILVTLFLRTRH
jgi:hypothetical protein